MAPLLQAAQVKYSLVVSRFKGDCRELASQAGPEVTALACGGGDGTIAEVQNGNLPGRNLPLVVIPTGSDNSLAATLGVTSPRQAALCMIKGDVIPMDTCTLHAVDTAGQEGPILTRPLCLVGWGFLSDVIVDIEKHRWMGPLKTIFCGLKKILRPLTLYPAKITYRPLAYAPPSQPCLRCQGLVCPSCAATAVGQPQAMLPCSFSRLAGVAIGLHRGKNMAVCDDGALWPDGVRAMMLFSKSRVQSKHCSKERRQEKKEWVQARGVVRKVHTGGIPGYLTKRERMPPIQMLLANIMP